MDFFFAFPSLYCSSLNVIMVHCVAVFRCASFSSGCNKTLRRYVELENVCVQRWRTVDGGVWWMQDKRHKEIEIASENMSIYWFSFAPAITRITSHSFMSAVPMATWSCHGVCVFACVSYQAGGNINDLYLWQHQRQSHQYTPIIVEKQFSAPVD